MKKQYQVSLTALCETAFMDVSNRLSVIGIFDRFSAKKFPGVLPKFTFVATISGKPSSKQEMKVFIKNPKGEILKEGKIDVSISVKGRASVMANFIGIVFEEAGNHTFSLEENGEIITSTILDCEVES